MGVRRSQKQEGKRITSVHLLAANCSHDILSPTSIPHSNLYDGTPSGFYITNITEDGEFTLISGVSVSIPSLKFNPTNKTFYYDPNEPLTVTAAAGTLLPSAYVVVRRVLKNPKYPLFSCFGHAILNYCNGKKPN